MTSTSSQAAAPVTTAVEAAVTSTGKAPTGKARYSEACAGTKDFFQGLEELSQMSGEPWDPEKAADELMELIQHPENFPELQELAPESNQPLEEDWDQLSKSDQEQIRKAVYAAAKGEC
ncbi:hypothetical protein GS461_09620 [Rhodococcus hoagii]|nr:hypothetical protein [Prescottella equi]